MFFKPVSGPRSAKKGKKKKKKELKYSQKFNGCIYMSKTVE